MLDCNLSATGFSSWPLFVAAALLVVGSFLFLWMRRKAGARSGTFLVIPFLIAAMLMAEAPPPSQAIGAETSACQSQVPAPLETSKAPSSGSTPSAQPISTATPSPSPSPSAISNDDFVTDTDGDGLPDSVELRFGSDPAVNDTDGDGLTDVEEATAQTDPTKEDSDNNGILDPADDGDIDGRDNRQELADGTQPFNPDTDGDGLSDGDEKARQTNPLLTDTDSDGISDGDEFTVGSNPLIADDTVARTRLVSTPAAMASFAATGLPSDLLSVAVEPAPTAEFGDVMGAIGTPVQVTANAGVSGTLTLQFDPSTVQPGANLAVVHFNEATGGYDQPATQQVDLATGTATVTTNQFSPFLIVDLNQFNQIWQDEIAVPRDPSTGTPKSIDSVLSIDSSGSMTSNDPSDQRKAAAKIFIDKLFAGDKVGVVDFDNTARLLQSLTTDFTLAKAAIDAIDSSGGTNIGAAVRAALDELDAQGSPARGRVIVLLTDGDGSYDPALTDRAVASKTPIYTIGLGSGTNQALLDQIATATGGKYYQVTAAGDLSGAFDRVGADIGVPDSDGDGLSDEAETKGWRTQRGNVYKTDPTTADTDGDSLADGEEAGKLISAAIGYSGISSPKTSDTDSDGLDDASEVHLGASPLSKDTDNDGLSDPDELTFGSDPSDSNADADTYGDKQEKGKGLDPNGYDLNEWEASGAAMGGFIFGDWSWGAEHVGRLTPNQRQSLQYLSGQIVSGIVVVGDVRDIIANVGAGDLGGALLSAAGFVPAIGDGAKIVSASAKFIKAGARAEKAAFRAIHKLPADLNFKKSLVGSVFGTGAKVFPKALDGGPATTVVYFGVRSGSTTETVSYVGITNNMARRQAQHSGKYDIRAQSPALSRGQARAIEEALIMDGGMVAAGGRLNNKIHSISPNHDYYAEALAWGRQWLKDNNVTLPN